MSRSERMARDDAARKRRKAIKDIVFERTQHLYNKMRKLRKKKQHNNYHGYLRKTTINYKPALQAFN